MATQTQPEQKKTLIGILASHDNPGINKKLSDILNANAQTKQRRDTLKKFRFAFTGGTFDRIILGTRPDGSPVLHASPVEKVTKNFRHLSQ